VENLPESAESECPVCLGHMEPEDRSGVAWLACPNGCPTEYEAPPPKLPEEALHKTAAA